MIFNVGRVLDLNNPPRRSRMIFNVGRVLVLNNPPRRRRMIFNVFRVLVLNTPPASYVTFDVVQYSTPICSGAR